MQALLFCYGYVFAVVALGEGLRHLKIFSPAANRKFVHVGVGLTVWLQLALFDNPWLAAVPPASFILVNYLSHKKQLLAMDTDADSLGTVYFPLSLALLVLVFWPTPSSLVAGMMAMTFGDAAAALVGERWGRHRYESPGGAKSLEGSLALFFATLLALLVSYRVLGFSWGWAWLAAPLLALLAALLETRGRRGTDNLWVPLGVALADYLLLQWPPPLGLVIGFWGALALGLAAYARGALSTSGVVGAVLTGTVLFGWGGWPGATALLLFFVTASLFSKLGKQTKAALEADYAKGSRRDLGQALANAGAAALFVGLAVARPLEPWWWVACLGALATANADTWATELGAFSHRPPRLITTLREVVPGTSGGITPLGLGASSAGALLIGLVAWGRGPWALVATAAGGLFGSLVDSLLGATLQGIYYCDRCGRETERRVHSCGASTRHRRGWPPLGNDWVNFLATTLGGLLAAGLYLLLVR